MENAQDKIYTVQEVADILKVHKDTVQRWMEEGKLGCIKIGYRTVRIQQSDIDKFIADKRAETNHVSIEASS